MNRICLDTSAYSNFKRGEPRIIETVSKAALVGIPSIVLGELRAGFALGRRKTANLRELSGFLSEPVVSVLDIDDEVSNHYAEIFLQLKEQGHPIPTNDLWIAAACARHGLVLQTYDAHFSKVKRISANIY